MARLLVLPGLVALVAAVAGCTPPVRLATPAEIQQANAPTPTPTPTPEAGSGAGSTAPGTSPAPAPGTAPAEPSVVQIDTSTDTGSGVVLDAQGDVVTNAHVVGSDRSFTVTTSDGTPHPASLVGSYAAGDLAVVRMSGAGGLTPAVFGDSNAVQVGDIVLALGSPLGLRGSVSEGIVSGVGRSESEGSGVTLTGMIQTTAAVSPGNSGGALVDISGHVVGVPTLGSSGSPRG